MAAKPRVYVDWNNDGDFSDTGEEVTTRVLDNRAVITVSYGRDQPRALSPARVGEAHFALNNQSRTYSPDNAGSILAGNVQPGRSVLVTATLGVTTYTVFNGHIDDFNLLPAREDRWVDVQCLDPLARLKNVQVSTSLYNGLRTGEAIGVILDKVGWSSSLRDLDVGATYMPWWYVDNGDAYDAIMQLISSEGPPALLTVDTAGRIVFRDRHHRLTRAASLTSQSTWRSSGTEPAVSSPANYNHGWKEIVNSVNFEVPLLVMSGIQAAVWLSFDRISLAAGETLPITARGSSPFTGADVPVAGTDYVATSGSVTITLSGTSGTAVTMFVTAVGGAAVIDNLQLRAYPLVTAATVIVSVEEPVSISKYGRRSLPEGFSPVWANRYDALAIAELIVGKRAERLPTITVTMKAGNSTRQAQQLNRNLSDRIHLTEAHTGLDADCYIEQITHTFAQAGADHQTAFGLEVVPATVANVLTFDAAGKGFNDGLFGQIGQDIAATMFRFDTSGQGFDQGLYPH